MADYDSLQSSKQNYRQPTSSFLYSPRLSANFVSKLTNETEFTMNSPTSILDTKPLKTPFSSDTKTPKSKNLWEKLDSRGLIDALIDEENLYSSKPENRTVLFGSQLKIQVPPLPHSVFSPAESPKSPGDFGIKTRHSHFGSFSPSTWKKCSPFGSSNSVGFSSEMELSEDYTCVIKHGPNPKTRHIFDDCVIESCCGVVKFSQSRNNNGFFSDRSMGYPNESFLSSCYNCKKNLGQGNDVYMYRGEQAFCSIECRYKEMMMEEEGIETLESEDVFGTSS